MKIKTIKIKNQGFTLIELLVVVAIVGLLSSVVLVAVNSARIKARDARRKSDLAQLVKALDLFYNEYNVYPCGDADAPTPGHTFDSSGSLPFLDGTGGLSVTNCLGLPTTGLYTAKIIAKPLTGDPLNTDVYYYWYEADNNRQMYVLSALLEKDPSSANDGGLCSRLWEVGSGTGIITPNTWLTPCN